MSCNNCGTLYQEESNFCAKCGIAKEGNAPTEIKKRKYTPYIAGAAGLLGVAIIAAIVIAVVIPLTRLAPLRPAQQAFSNLGSEISERIESSPFYALTLLGELAQNDAMTMNFDFDYRPASMWDPDVRGNLTLGLNSVLNAAVVEGEVRVLGLPIDLAVHINEERIAARSRVISNDFYGITFETFERDFRQFANVLGLDEFTVREIIDLFDMFDPASSTRSDLPEDWADKYSELFLNFILGLEFTSTSAEIGRGSAASRVQLIEFALTQSDIANLLNDLIDMLDNDNYIRDMFASFGELDPTFDLGVQGFDEMIRELRAEVRDFERDNTVGIVLGLYIGNGNRMAQMRLVVDVEDRRWNDEYRTEILLNFGNSVTDTWTIEVEVTDRWGTDRTIGGWEFSETASGYENRLFIGMGRDRVTLGATWNPDNGRFMLSYSDSWSDGSIGGTFNVGSDNSFSLRFDPLDIFGDSLAFGMSAEAGANIPDISFVNMDQWDAGLLDLLERSIMGLFW